MPYKSSKREFLETFLKIIVSDPKLLRAQQKNKSKSVKIFWRLVWLEKAVWF